MSVNIWDNSYKEKAQLNKFDECRETIPLHTPGTQTENARFPN